MASSRQEGKLVWNGLLALPVDQAASLLALLEETTFANVMGKKGKSIFSKEDEFAQALQARTEELSRIEQPALILRLLGKLEEIAGVDPGYLASGRDFEDLCGELASSAVTLKKQGDKKFEGSELLDLVAFVMREILKSIEDEFESLSEDEQGQIVGKLSEFLASLPKEQQQVFRESLEVDTLTDDVIRQAIIKGSLGVAFSTLVSVAGFAFYTTAVSMLASLAALVGLTLPFAAYIALSSWIAVLSDPITITLVLTATFAAGWWKGDQKIQQTLYPLVIVQLAASSNSAESVQARPHLETRVFSAWHVAVNAYSDAKKELEKLGEQRHTCQDELRAAKADAKALSERHDEIAAEINASWVEVREIALDTPESIQAGEWGAAYKDLARPIIAAKTEFEKSENASNKEGILERVAESVVRGYDGWTASSRLNDALDALILALKADQDKLSIDDPLVVPVLSHLRTLVEQIEVENEKHTANEERIERCKHDAAELDEQISSARTELQELEAQYFGIKKSEADWPDVGELAQLPAVADERLLIALNRPLVPQSEEQRLTRLLGGGRGDSAFGGSVVGDFLYDYLRIDPLVMEGIDFARAADLSNPLLFAAFANEQATLMAEGGGDSIARLQGYVAERMVAQHMAAAGHDVSFPETSNQAGYDLLIDGQPFQVKCTESASYVREHLEKYPDIPVIVNAEHAEALANVPGVYVNPALSVTDVTAMTEAGIADGAELLDFELPWIALAVSTAVEIRDLYHSRTGLTNSAINIATDTASRTAIGTLGAYAGSAIGPLLFGPAGSVIGALGGAVGGGIGGGRLAKFGRLLLVGDESDAVRNATRALAGEAAKAVPKKLTVWREKRRQVSELIIEESEHSSEVGQIKNWLQQKMDNDARYFEQRQRELERIAGESEKTDPYDLSHQVLDLIGRAGIHPHMLQTRLRQLFSALKELGSAAARFRLGNSKSGGPPV